LERTRLPAIIAADRILDAGCGRSGADSNAITFTNRHCRPNPVAKSNCVDVAVTATQALEQFDSMRRRPI
jgi:hypothetical protein